MKIVVCGLGAISAIGNDIDQMMNSIRLEERGVGELTLFSSSIDVPVCEVKLSNSELKRLVGENENISISRTALLGMIAAKSAVSDAQIPEGARVG